MPDLQLPHHHGEGQNTKFLKAQLSKPETFQTVAGTFKLLDDSSRLLDFVDTDIVESFNNFEKMADDYNLDAAKINDLVSDFSATSEELVASITNITQAIDGISSASNDSAAGTTNIAQKTVSIASGSAEVMKGAKDAESSAEELRKNVNNFIIEENLSEA